MVVIYTSGCFAPHSPGRAWKTRLGDRPFHAKAKKRARRRPALKAALDCSRREHGLRTAIKSGPAFRSRKVAEEDRSLESYISRLIEADDAEKKTRR
jgi:hypothetical protein